MRNLKLILLFFFCISNLNAQTSDLASTTNSAKLLYSELKEKEKSPIWVINGMLFEDGSLILSTINPKNVKSIDILKDQATIDKYGEKGKNGVVLMTLKNSETKFLNKLAKRKESTKFDKNQYKILISGIITDTLNNPVAAVVISNLTKEEAYYSDFDGKYNMNVSANDILNFSCKGLKSQVVEITNQTTLNIVLKKSTSNSDTQIIIDKPVIYLYPTSKTDISFSLNFKGTILTTFPKYESDWQITAYPDGKIFDKKTNRYYTSLFWDGTRTFADEHYKYKNGFVVSKNDLIPFLVEKLETMGLNTSETNDFIQFWLPVLEKNETNFIHFYNNSDYDIFSTNTINPKPNTAIRIFMEFYALEDKIDIPEQKLSKTERNGFTLVEWGGSNVSEPLNNLKLLKL